VSDVRNSGSGSINITYKNCHSRNICGKLANDVYIVGSGSVYISTSSSNSCGSLVNNVHDQGSGHIYLRYGTKECEKSFNSLKQAMITSPVLIYPRTDKEFILDTDASNEGTGVLLSQKIGNEECVIAYFSRTLGNPERNYCVTRKELLAVVKSIEHFYQYLYGPKFLLRTDHASLRWLLNFREPEDQLARCIQRLQENDFEILQLKCISHGNADALSRRPCKESCKHCTNAEKKFGMETDISVKVLIPEDPWSSSEIQKAQLLAPQYTTKHGARRAPCRLVGICETLLKERL
ncbi:Retrovirus-related Pol polyprotein from transposon 297, partial [Araneus ventricosus]